MWWTIPRVTLLVWQETYRLFVICFWDMHLQEYNMKNYNTVNSLTTEMFMSIYSNRYFCVYGGE